MASSPLDTWMEALVAHIRSGRPDLTNRQMALMIIVCRTPGPHTVRGLAATLKVSKPVITRALNTLSALGYLRRQRDENDRRSVIIAHTRNGARFLERFEKLLQPTKPKARKPAAAK